ncbi:ADP-ribose pyrophosphatase YjhB (NUDIX family) [Friedmanniella endophytica]|uniref:ADP-ribose pyrophosphatase YjhB (NUDIX family) n=1 Tax=Microlunatus kandeliicorticis TaxID=1759536 RepID=A0A7W3P4J1_9ACTN|nr:NUDIX domain-containing protein [Microlunatus kandeliicorticis]MBA8792973.1 ADP-ribose pyrophosphatase YjhB (NUDIX family) [Microlunatus kandeliicorticis]
MPQRRTRVGAYAVCVRDGRLLLVHQISPGPAANRWTLPGGGVDFGEDPVDAVHREVREETGGRVELGRVLGVHANVYEIDHVSIHGVRLLYAATVDGELAPGPGEEIDRIGWHPVDDLPAETTAWARLGAELAHG